MKKIGIVLINFNSEKETVACIESLLAMQVEGFTILICVVDNASHAESLEYLKAHLPKTATPFQIELLIEKKNLGFTGGNNIGMKFVLTKGVDAVVLLNNDTLVDKNLVQELSKTADAYLNSVIVPKIYFAKGHEYHADRYSEKELGHVFWYAGGEIDWNHVTGKHRGVNEVDTGQYDVESKTAFASGCCLYIPRKIVEKVGMFDDDYFLYFEDADFSERVKKAGFTIYYAPTAIVWHKNAGSTGGSGSDLQDYYISRNRMLFGMEYAPIRTKIALLRESLQLLRNGRTWQKAGIKDYYQHRLGKGTYK